MQFWQSDLVVAMGTNPKKMTIKEIAKLSNVSTATVSRVINNERWVSKATREKVQEVIKETAYRPNFGASMMVTGKSKMIVIIVATIMNPFFSEFTSVAINEFKREGYSTIVFETNNREEEELEFLNGAFVGLADGIISVTDCIDSKKLTQAIHPVIQRGKPVLFVDRDLSTNIADSVVNDNIGAIGDVVSRMFKLGHERIAMILGQDGVSVVQDKIKGYRQAFVNANKGINEEYLRSGSWSIETGFAQTIDLLQMKAPPTAFIAGNNMICHGILDAFDEVGLTPGKDISIVGTEECRYDERIFSKLNISTLKLDSVTLAKYASRHIVDRINNVRTPVNVHSRTIYNMEFIDRGSIVDITSSDPDLD